VIEVGLPPGIVICNPDRPTGRKKIITPPEVKVLAQKYDLKVWQPEKLNTEDWKKNISEIDVAIVAAYGQIIPKEVLEIPRQGTIGVHPSLLPKYRGATPIQNTILSGDEVTGTTLFLIDEKVDHGPIISSTNYKPLSNETYLSLEQKLAELSAELIIEALPKYLSGKIKTQSQEESEATYTEKFSSNDAFVDLEKDSPNSIERKIRALNPEPGVWTNKDNNRVKLLEAEIKDGKLVIKKIQIAGGVPRALNNGNEFLN